MGKKLSDLPTIELGREELARYARQADQTVRQQEVADQRATLPPERVHDSSPEIDLMLEVDFAEDAAPSDWPAMTSVPCVIGSKEDVSWFTLDEKASVVVAMVDGKANVESIVTALAMPAEEVLAVLRELVEHGVIDLF